MKALLDTNIIIHREAHRIINEDIGILFKWIDKTNTQKYIHPATVEEIKRFENSDVVKTFLTKLDSYELLRTTAPMNDTVAKVCSNLDKNQNDKVDTILLNELFAGRVDIFISEDKKIHQKANLLGIGDKVFNINSYLEKIYAEFPDLVDYKVLSVQQKYFGELSLKDNFFDSLKEDYPGFEKWFNKKSDERAYVTLDKESNNVLSFLYLKKEDESESYIDITPRFLPKKRLKVGTFKVVSNGVKLGERFLKIIFDNALIFRVDEIYVTIFNKRVEQLRLISLLEEWGFVLHGTKENGENVYIRNFSKEFNLLQPKRTYPFFGVSKNNIFLVPIYPDYHTDLMPDSILHNESKAKFVDDEPHRNAISKVYISRSYERKINKGDVLIFYRTGGYYQSVITTIAVVEDVIFKIKDLSDFILKCRKRSVFTNAKLAEFWNYRLSNRPFIVNFLYFYSFPTRINLKRLIEIGIIKDLEDVPRGFKKISVEQFKLIVKETETNESIVVD